jgi:hypothetical protein
MGVYFLFSFNVLSYAFFGRVGAVSTISKEFSLVSKDALDEIFSLGKYSSDCFLYSPAQATDKIKGGLLSNQVTRFNEVVERENTTLGVRGFNPEDKETLLESAKALSEKGNTIIIVEKEEEKNYLEFNEKIIALTPAEFMEVLEMSKDLCEKISSLKIIDALLINLFWKEESDDLKLNVCPDNISPVEKEEQQDDNTPQEK